MTARRDRPVVDPVRLTVDGEDVIAERGEPVAVALAAAGRAVLARSVKYHRPRGAACYRGRCDGCLMRVDGIGNTMTCQVPAAEGMTVETQNVVGTAERDLLAASDWFFPSGMDHHHMFTRFSAVNRLMQKVARRIAGIGELPDHVVPTVAPRQDSPDALVVGGGLGGLRAAATLAEAGARVVLVEEAAVLGGDLAIFPGEVDTAKGPRAAAELVSEAIGAARQAGVDVRLGASAVGVYEREVAVIDPDGLLRLRPKRLVVATGVHESPLGVAGADLPNVVGARAAAVLLASGVLVGARVAIVGEGDWGVALARALSDRDASVLGPFRHEALASVHGRLSASGISVVAGAGKTTRHRCDAVVIDSPVSAVYELGAQAGLGVAFRDGAFLLDGFSSDSAEGWAQAVGSCTGHHTVEATRAQAAATAASIIGSLGAAP